MKKTFFIPQIIALVFTLSFFSVNAQNFYVDGHVGYGFGINGETNLFVNETTFSTSSGQFNYQGEAIKLSLGRGFNFGINGGYFFNKNIGVDLGLNYQIGSSTESKRLNIYERTDQSNQLYRTTNNNEITLSSNILHITPAIVLKTEFQKFSPYVKMGLVMGTGKIKSSSTNSRTYSSPQPAEPVHREYELEYYGGLALGFEGAFGVTFTINENLSWLAETYFRSMSYAPKNGLVTKSIENGVDVLNNLSDHEKNIKYSKEYSYNSNQDTPQETSMIRLPYNSLGLKIGMRFNL